MQRIHRLYRTKSDIENLSRLTTSIPTGQDITNYKRIVVNKPWGYEYLIFENKFVAIWVLYIAPNQKTSMHCHPQKKTSLVVLSGVVRCSGLEGWYDKKEGEGVHIEEAVFHQTTAVSNQGVFLMEIESPPNKKDLVRLNDAYGREGKGYEGKSFVSRKRSEYTYFDFHHRKKMFQEFTLHRCTIMLHHVQNQNNLHDTIARSDCHIVSLLGGRFQDEEGSVVLSTGDSIELERLVSLQPKVVGDITYLTLRFETHTPGV